MLSRIRGAELAVLAWSSVCPLVAAAPINCAVAGDDVEQAICAQPELLARDRAISGRLDQFKQQCQGAQNLMLEGQAARALGLP